MNKKRFLTLLFGLVLLLAWTRENLAAVHKTLVQPLQIEDSLRLIEAHGGTLDDRPEVGSHDANPFFATFTALLETGKKVGDDDLERPEDGKKGEPAPPAVSAGLILILHNLGLGELAANLLWIQMDSDSHAGLWHRVNFYLELIPKIDPHFVEAFLLRANLLDQGFRDVAKAMDLLETGIRSNPFHSELYVQLGVYALNYHNLHGPKRDLKKALEAFSKALAFPETPAHICRLYALTMAATGKRDEAVGFLKKVKEIPGRGAFDLSQDNLVIQRIESGEQF